MAKTYLDSVKYVIKCYFEIKGPVDKPDIIGAVFGQSEGLLGEELDLKELQKNGRLGRIEISHKTVHGKTSGTITIPTSLDMAETSVLAAAIESVDKVGPFEAIFETKQIEDTRNLKRQQITNRAKELLNKIKGVPESTAMTETVREDARTAHVTRFGREKIAAGPRVEEDDSIIVVEGRADVINLLKNGIKNVIEMGGAKPAKSLIELCRQKTVTLFIDGDRGGELNTRNLTAQTNVNFIARAPEGKEVEELTRKEIVMALRKKIPAGEQATFKPREFTDRPARWEQRGFSEDKFRPRQRDFESTRFQKRGLGRNFDKGGFEKIVYGTGPRHWNNFGKTGYRDRFEKRPRFFKPFSNTGGFRKEERRGFGRGGFRREEFGEFQKREPEIETPLTPEQKKLYEPIMKELKGTLKAKIFDTGMKELGEIEVRQLLDSLKEYKEAKTIVFDGIVTKRLVEQAKAQGVETIVGIKKGKIEKDSRVSVFSLSV